MTKKSIVIVLSLVTLAMGSSFTIPKEKTGVLILAHGGKHSSWDEAVKNATQALQKEYVVEMAFGMANPTTMQAGINRLESQGVTKIVVVPLFISSYSPIIRQNEYLLGFRDKLADPPMLMMHHGDSESKTESSNDATHGGSHEDTPHKMEKDASKKVELEPLKFKSKILLTKPLDDNPLVAKIIYDRIAELSVNPTNETVLLVAHGPGKEEDNKNWLKEIDSLADQIRALQAEKGNKFRQIFGLTVRDDADAAIYEQAKEQLRSLVYQSGKDGDVIVIPLLLSQGGVEARYVKRLEGLTYKWSGKTLLPHPYITQFIQESVEDALKNQ